ncbi:ammonium transporter [Marinilabilia rubra]|uniref:Ammonium transporter n=1 Tax=Marinilabilia rubra TaxID=2162893 RepID=A0A2U2BCS1_9BACT|nr:ammonium transporter [Marinilabilia rubra]PWE00827.1 ammonium transporter [Marinilabilia rubra]
MEETVAKVPEVAEAAIGLDISINTIWLLLATVLVMFMQPGFAMVESGFTRAKNTANILMKNLMDFSSGSFFYWLIGYSIMYGTGNAFIGDFSLFAFSPETDSYAAGYSDYADLMFQTVFAATAATIVSGAMAERTKFSAYLIFTIVITLIIYPVSGHWTWGGGWLSELGFIDFAGSTIVHSVGAWVGLAGAIIIGPRIGKYDKDGKAKAIPGHNIGFGALGVFILWFGWFGFNAGSELAATGESTSAIARIALTTNLSAAAGAIMAMFVSWIRYKRPTLSLSLNGALAGLVAITAGTAAVSPLGALVIGAIAGVVLVFSVEFIDQKLKVDDPVGAISVHGVCGALGTLLVGVFAIDGGLLYGGGLGLLGIQAIGVLAIAAWSFIAGLILFAIIKATNGLRVEKKIEEEGLDVYEHGESAYDTF